MESSSSAPNMTQEELNHFQYLTIIPRKCENEEEEMIAKDLFCGSLELVLHMMNFLHPLDLARISRVCKEWKELSGDHLIWRRFITEYNYPVDASTMILPLWASSWQDAWKWYYVCRNTHFKDDEEKTGLGTYVWPSNGSRYEGEWKNNKENGRGTKYWPDGAYFEGEWSDAKFNGFGKHTWASGSSYEGTWLNHKRNGFGKNTWIQKDLYEGDWCEDMKNGYGVYVWFDGRKYEGSWTNDKRSGYGVFSWPKLGCRYEGHWKEDNRHGFGKFAWKDGDIYEGEWLQGKRYGKGKLITRSGCVYEQEWKEIEEFDASNKGDISMPLQFSEDQGYNAPKRKNDESIPSLQLPDSDHSTKKRRL